MHQLVSLVKFAPQSGDLPSPRNPRKKIARRLGRECRVMARAEASASQQPLRLLMRKVCPSSDAKGRYTKATKVGPIFSFLPKGGMRFHFVFFFGA